MKETRGQIVDMMKSHEERTFKRRLNLLLDLSLEYHKDICWRGSATTFVSRLKYINEYLH